MKLILSSLRQHLARVGHVALVPEMKHVGFIGLEWENHPYLPDVHAIFTGINELEWDFMGDLMGFHGRIMRLDVISDMGISWDIQWEWDLQHTCGGFHKWGYPKWMVYNGKWIT